MILVLAYHSVQGQEHRGFEALYYPGTSGVLSALSAKVFHQDNSGWYTEVRYNYEQEKTVACSVGKTFAKERAFTWYLTPTTGLIAGRSQGVLFGLDAVASFRKISLSTLIQDVSCFIPGGGSFLFSWTELGWQATTHLYAGLVLQQTLYYHAAGRLEPGLQCSLSFGGWSFPIYCFRTADNHCYLATGLCYEWKKNNRDPKH